MLDKQRHQRLYVAVGGAEGIAPIQVTPSQLGSVVDFAIADQPIAAVRARERLVCRATQVDDRQSPRAENGKRVVEETVAIRSPVMQRVAGATHGVLRPQRCASQAYRSKDAAHDQRAPVPQGP